jgi:hypothetical protein
MIEILCNERSYILAAYSAEDDEPASEFAFFFAALAESLPIGLLA